jgi:hypothetical protein
MKQLSKILTLILFTFIFCNLSAQEDSFKDDPVVNSSDDNRKFRFGLQLIPNVSWISPSTNGYSNEGSKLKFNYGLSTEFFLTKNYLFSTGVIISTLGGEISYEGLYKDVLGAYFPTKVKQSYSIQYLEIPLTLKLRTNQVGYMTYYGNFGLRSAIKLKSSSDFTYVDIPSSPKFENEDTGSDVFFMNTWLVIGAGAEYNIAGNTNLSFGITYNNGFINMMDSKSHELGTDGKATLDASGNPAYTDKKVRANINYFALEIGIYF